MDIIKDDLIKIKKRIEDFIFDPTPNNEIKKFLSNGSKFIRSSLAILYLKSQNIEITDDVLKILIAGEIIHNASLLHDDVLDDAHSRRGEATLANKYNAKLSILSGDYLLAYALDFLIEIEDFRIIKIFKNCTQKMSEAEIKQYFLRNNITTEDEYINICKGKTATLFSAILEGCALLSNISTENANKMGKFFGLCFQINNDLKTESANIDQQNGIQTAMDVLGIEKTTALLDNYKEEMRNILKDFPASIYKKGLEDLIDSL